MQAQPFNVVATPSDSRIGATEQGRACWLDAHPGSCNVIPGRAKFGVDLHVADDVSLTAMDHVLRAACEWVADVRQSAERLGLPSMDVISDAGHDAIYHARVAPSAMLFAPCKDGISRDEIEDPRADHQEAGGNVLLQVPLKAASKAENLRT